MTPSALPRQVTFFISTPAVNTAGWLRTKLEFRTNTQDEFTASLICTEYDPDFKPAKVFPFCQLIPPSMEY